ncbi:MAG: hypothetical protein AAF499_16855, partial [Pseudomonadota bacterium]
LFLFFGWFREVERYRRRWRYRPGSPDLHLLFGWLQVGDTVHLDSAAAPAPWATHVHCQRRFAGGNQLYIAADAVVFGDRQLSPHGGGCWTHVTDARTLTRPGASRSHWRLPGDFLPIETHQGIDCLSCHTRPERWRRRGAQCDLHLVPRGQEFVLDCTRRPGVLTWLETVFASDR